MPLWWSHGVNTIKGPRGLCVCLSHSQFSEREKENRRRWWIVGASQASERVGVCDTFSRWTRSLHDQSFVARAPSCHIAGAQSFPILRFVPTRVQNPTIGFDDRDRSYPVVITLRKRGRGKLISTNCKVYAKNRLSAICAKNLVCCCCDDDGQSLTTLERNYSCGMEVTFNWVEVTFVEWWSHTSSSAGSAFSPLISE